MVIYGKTQIFFLYTFQSWVIYQGSKGRRTTLITSRFCCKRGATCWLGPSKYTSYRVKSGNFGQQVNSDIPLQTVEIQMRRLLMSRLIWISTVCLVYFSIPIIKIWNKQVSCPNLPDVQSYLTLPYHFSVALLWANIYARWLSISPSSSCHSLFAISSLGWQLNV